MEGWTAEQGGEGGEGGAGGTAAAAAEKVTSIQLGLTEGTENRNLWRVAEAAYNEDTKVAARVARDNGLEFVAVGGGAIETMVNVNGEMRVVKSRGCVVDGKMFVRVDDSTFTAEQIARHEAAHEQIRKGEIDVEQTRQKLLEQYSDAEIDAIIELYASAYGDSGLTAEEVLEEIVCDAEAQMNAFATEQTERIAGEVGMFLRNVGKSANAQKAAAIKNTTGNGGVKQETRRSEYLDAAAIQAIQSIGRKSINDFNTSDFQKTEAFARRYWQEMGVKSPFFRAWFGDWRANDKTPIQIADQKGDTRGVVKNQDTGWDIQVSRKVFNETKNHTNTPNRAAQPYLPYINDIASKAILLDSVGIGIGKVKSENSLLMHNMYAVADMGNGPEVLKLYVEEMNDPNFVETKKRAYQLQNIEKYQPTGKSSQNTASSIRPAAGTVHTVADLFALVKRMDANFKPNSASKVVNADGTPKVVYHGTNKDFTAFQSASGMYWFSESKDYAEEMAHERRGKNVIGAYLNIKNPYITKLSPNQFSNPNYEAGIIRKAIAGKHDGIIITNDTTNDLMAETFYVVFDNKQIKSATDNIGTFDGSNPDIRYSREMDTMKAMKNTTGNGGVKYSLEAQKIPTWEELEAKLPIKVVDISKAETSGSFAERRAQLKNQIDEIIKRPYLNKDTGTLIFLTRKSYTHLFSNYGELQINAAEHLPEFIENAVLTHAEGATHGSEHTEGVYTFFAAAYADGVRPVKLKVKEYRNEGQQIPENVIKYFRSSPKEYASSYDTVVLTVENIEGIPGSAHSMTEKSAEKKRPSKPSEVIVTDLLNLVKGNAEKYIPDKNKAGNQDIRYSREMDTVKALERQNKILKERVEFWKDQTRKTKAPTADRASVRRLGREILSSYSSSTKVDEILPELQWLANDAIGKSGASYGALTEAAERIARKVLEGSGVDVNGELAEERQALKKYLRSTPINVTESIKAGIPDFAAYKKQNRALHFREDGSGTDVDRMWLELQDRFGTGMFPEDVMNPEDQVRYIADKVAAMAEHIQNPYQKDMEFAVQQLTYDILFQTTMVEQKKPTRADQAAEKTDKAVEKATEEMRKLLEKGRQRENDRIVKAQKAESLQKIRTISDKFQRMATRPGKGISQHAPEKLRRAVVDFCSIFTESELRRMDRWGKSLEYRADKLAQKMGDKVTKSTMDEYNTIENQQARRDRMTARLTALQNAYAAMEKDGEYQTTYDQTVADMIGKLSEVLEEKDIYQLDSKELRQVQQTMTTIYYTITNANKAFAMGKDKTITGMATKMAGEIRQVNPSQAGLTVALKRFIQWQMSPDTFFNALCGFSKGNEGKVIQKGFQRGAERMLATQREFYQMFQEFTESDDGAVTKELNHLMNYSQKRMVNWGLKDMEGNEVKTTRGMMLQAYMLLNQQDSFESLQYGGFSIPNADRYYKGDVSGSYGDALETQMMSEPMAAGYTEMVQRNKDLRSRMEELQQKLELADSETYKRRYRGEIQALEKEVRENQQRMETIANQVAQRLYNIRDAIEKQLTPLERKLIDRAHEWYSHSGKLMQDVFQQMYGFRTNLVENYVPIHRDPSTIKTDIRDMAGAEKAFNLENSGFTIERVKNYQPILLTDFFEEITRQRDKMARYVGFAQVQKDFGKIWKTRINGSGMTVNTLVRARFGAGKTWLGVSGEEYVNHYIADVAGGHSSDDILSKFYGNYAAATLRFNLRVAASQAASIPTAASVVGWKHMAIGFAKGLPKAFSTKYRNELAIKNVWFYKRYQGEGGSTELADIRKKGGMFERIANSKTGKRLFNWCQAVDVFSTGSIMWSAAESYVQEQGIQKGTAEYDAAVNETYTDIIRKSQPNYTTTERSDMLRDQRAHMKLLTMFKTQSNQNFNLLLEANGEFIRMKQDLKNGRNGVTEADVKAAGKKLANASTGVLLGGTVSFVAIRTILNFILGAVNPYRDDETDEVTIEATMKGIGEEILSSLAGTVALGGQVYDFLMPIMTGEKYYGLSDSAVSSLSSMLENTVTVLQKGTDASEKQLWKMVNGWCTGFGIPSGNAKKITDMFGMYIRDIQSGTFGQYKSPNTTDKQYRARIMKHYLAGEMDKADDALGMLFTRSSEDDDEAARKKIAEGMRDYLKDRYIESEITDTEAEKIMAYTGTDEPEKYTARWDFQLAHPEIDSQNIDGLVKAYNQKGNISDKVFLDAWEFAKDAAADKDKDGKTINGSKKQKIVDYVQAIPGLTKDQRRKLFELLNAGSVKGTPFE